jgi:hypothetical protein
MPVLVQVAARDWCSFEVLTSLLELAAVRSRAQAARLSQDVNLTPLAARTHQELEVPSRLQPEAAQLSLLCYWEWESCCASCTGNL